MNDFPLFGVVVVEWWYFCFYLHFISCFPIINWIDHRQCIQFLIWYLFILISALYNYHDINNKHLNLILPKKKFDTNFLVSMLCLPLIYSRWMYWNRILSIISSFIALSNWLTDLEVRIVIRIKCILIRLK